MKLLVNNLDAHPLGAFLTAIIGIGTGTGLHFVYPLLQAAPPSISHDGLDVTVKLFQCAAYAGGALAGFVSFHGWFVKRYKKK